MLDHGSLLSMIKSFSSYIMIKQYDTIILHLFDNGIFADAVMIVNDGHDQQAFKTVKMMVDIDY